MDAYSLGSTPISNDNPQGIDAKYEPEYTIVTDEIAKLGSTTHGGIVWSTVAAQGEAILEKKSKDLQIATYVGVAWQAIGGVEGIYNGATLISTLLENFWETAYPPLNKIRRRTNAINWWHEYTYAALDKYSQGPDLAAELVNKLAASIKKLDQLIGDFLPDATPLHDLQEIVRRLPVVAPVEPPKEEPVVEKKEEVQEPQPPQAPADPAPTLKETPPTPKPVTEPQTTPKPVTEPQAPQKPESSSTEQDFETTAQEFASVAIRYALMAHQEKAEDPLPWQIIRLAQWGKAKRLPPANDGQTHIPPPDQDRLNGLTKMFAAGKYLEVALGCEELFTVAMFWLDVQYLTCKALDALGDSFADASNRVREETARFIQRLTGIENLAFDDGTPFANQETRDWLAGLDANADVRPAIATSAMPSPLAQDKNERFACAERLCSENNLAAGLSVLEEGLSSSPATNMAVRAQQLRLLCLAKERDIALALAQGLLAELDERNVASFDHDLAVDVLLAAREAFTLAKDKEMAANVQSKIGRLRPAAALGWKG